MTDNERELIHIIRNHDVPEQGMMIALNIILDYLTRPESSESKLSVDSREFVETVQA